MTGEKVSLIDIVKSFYDETDEMVRADVAEYHTHWQIACIMRRAASLPYSETPASAWQEEGTPELFSIVCEMVSAVSGPTWGDNKSALKELRSLIKKLRALKRQILSLDETLIKNTNENVDDFWDQRIEDIINKKYTLDEFSLMYEDFLSMRASPDYQTPIETTIEQMDRLEKGLTCTLEDVESVAAEMEDMGQTRTYAAKQVAFGVATYMHQVTGKISGFYTGNNPSGKYSEAVLEIFDILGIPHGSLQRAGEYAIEKLEEHHTAKLKDDP